MGSVKIGDRIRFLNQVGGGEVVKIMSRDTVLVRDEDGFDVPTLISECVVVESKTPMQKRDERNAAKAADQRKAAAAAASSVVEEEIDEPVVETKEGDVLNVCLGFVPHNAKMLTTTATDVYLINDSNYFLVYNIFNMGKETAFSRKSGTIMPNVKEELETLSKDSVGEMENIGIQIMAFKRSKTYEVKPAYDIRMKINPVKFYKLHSYTSNDYFDEDALIIPVITDDVAQDAKAISPRELEQMIRSKETPLAAKVSQRSNVKPEKIVVDLHIAQLLDDTTGMSSKDMLDYQIQKFRSVMDENASSKGQKIVFIHGKGEGVLRAEIMKELKKHYPKCEYQDASFREYGFGATQITIK